MMPPFPTDSSAIAHMRSGIDLRFQEKKATLQSIIFNKIKTRTMRSTECLPAVMPDACSFLAASVTPEAGIGDRGRSEKT
jgi:hypothetical protein